MRGDVDLDRVLGSTILERAGSGAMSRHHVWGAELDTACGGEGGGGELSVEPRFARRSRSPSSPCAGRRRRRPRRRPPAPPRPPRTERWQGCGGVRRGRARCRSGRRRGDFAAVCGAGPRWDALAASRTGRSWGGLSCTPVGGGAPLGEPNTFRFGREAGRGQFGSKMHARSRDSEICAISRHERASGNL